MPGTTSLQQSQPYQPGDLWWKGNREEAWQRVVGVVDYLLQTPEETSRRRDDVDHARLYGNRYFRGFGPFQFAKPAPAAREEERLRANVCKPVVDTATSLTAGRNRPKATLITNGGDWTQKRRAKRADRFVEGVFSDARVHTKAPQAFRDGCIFGTGVLKFHAATGRVVAERRLPAEILVDHIDGMHEKPRCLYEIAYVDRRVLIELYGKKSETLKRALLEASVDEDPDVGVGRTTTAEPVRVVEAWHLPSGPDAKDGRHAIVINGATLRFEPWERERFPFAFFRWSHRILGFWGTGLVEEIKPIQLDINVTLKRIKECLHLMAVPRIFIQQSAKAIKSLITNEVGAIIPYAGTQPPTFLTPPSVPPELFAHLRWLIAQAFEQSGVSQMAATSQKPAGLDSAKAIREFNDLGADRGAVAGREYEEFHLECARIVMDLAEELQERADAEKGDGLTAVYVKGRKHAEKIRWADVRMDQEEYTLQVHPTSALPRDPAGRTATIEEWIAQGWLDEREGKRLLDFPDLDSESDVENAGRDLVDMQIERMLDHEPLEEAYDPPDPVCDIAYAFKRSQLTIALGRLDGAPEERLDLLRDYSTAAESLAAPMQQQAQAAAQPPGPMPGAAQATPAIGLAA